jgi:hypothetical protein
MRGWAALLVLFSGCVYDPMFDMTRCSRSGACPAALACEPVTWVCVSPFDAGTEGGEEPDGPPPPVDGSEADLAADAPVGADLAADLPIDRSAPDRSADTIDAPAADRPLCQNDPDCYAGPGPVCLGVLNIFTCVYGPSGCLELGPLATCKREMPCMGDPPNARCTPIPAVDAQ